MENKLPYWPFKDGVRGDDALHNYLWEMHQFIKELDERVKALEGAELKHHFEHVLDPK